MESALIVSNMDKSTAFFMEMLATASISQITVSQSCSHARRLLLERDFDLVIVNAPMKDETGENLSRQIASKNSSQVMLVVKSEYYEAISASCEKDGILTIAKPISRPVFWSALMLAKSAQNRLSRMQAENARLVQKIEDIRIVDRAKCILISCLNMSEQEAHRYIEKQAMDMRESKRAIAEGILRTYEN